MAVDVALPRTRPPSMRRVWLVGTLTLTLGSITVAVALAPPAGTPPVRGLTWLLFVGSSVHVAATGWFFTVPEVRAHARLHPRRYLVAPVALVIATAAVAALLSPHRFAWALTAFFAWQFFHFQRQNLGMSALAAVAYGAPSLTRIERLAITTAGVGGIIGLLAHPELLRLAIAPPVRWVFYLGLAVFAVGALSGLVALARRSVTSRPAAFATVQITSLLFFLPVFVFTSPYAAVAGLTLAHGFQYLLIVGLVAAGRREASPAIALGVLFNVALFGGISLNLASHLHGGSSGARLLYGAYLGLVMTHFVVDAGLWRLREEFPRRFLTSTLPYLLGR